ncbi:MAG: hypothetical protein RR365_05045 [Bacteroides sp.]
MKRILFLLLAIGMTAMSSTSMAAMSKSRVRTETRFLTDKMAYELNLSTNQYNDAYEINYDFISSIRYVMDDVIRGYEWALDDYYQALDLRNDDLRYVLTDRQYRRFLRIDYFYRPVYTTGNSWNFRIYVTYVNHNHYYYGRPYHYRSYCGNHYRKSFHDASYYSGRYNQSYYSGSFRTRDESVYRNNRRSDFGTVNIRPNTSSRREESSSSRRERSSTRNENPSSRRESSSSSRRESSSTRNENSSSSRDSSSSSRRESSSGRREKSSVNREKSGSEVRESTKTERSSGSSRSSSRRSNRSNQSSERR